MGSKNKDKGLYAGIGIFVVFVLAFILFAQPFSISEQSKYIEVPTFGFIRCDPTSPITKIFMLKQEDVNDVSVPTPLTCRGTALNVGLGLVEDCTLTAEVINGDLTPTFSTTAFLQYQLVNAGTGFREDTSTLVSGGLAGYDNNEQFTIRNMEQQDVLWIRYAEGTAGSYGGKKIERKIKVSITGTPYTLKNYNFLSQKNGGIMDNARVGNCVLEDNAYKDKQITYKDSAIEELKELDDVLNWRNLNMIGGTYVYMAKFVTIPNFGNQIEQFKGQTSYCLDRKMYKTLKITSGGNNYEIVNYDRGGFIGDVLCCNGETDGNKVCQNHEWIELAKAECDLNAGIFCPQSTYQPFEDKKYKRFACEENKCVEDIIKVECNKESDCGNGEVCATDKNPENNKCVLGGSGAGTSVCGDNICDVGETSCPTDCGGTTTDSNAGLWLIIAFFVIVVLIMIVIKNKQGNNSGGKLFN